jgi:hypothetical protein
MKTGLVSRLCLNPFPPSAVEAALVAALAHGVKCRMYDKQTEVGHSYNCGTGA